MLHPASPSSPESGARRLTPAGVGGVAVVEVVGESAAQRLSRWFTGALPVAGAIAYGRLDDPTTGATLDEVLVLRRPDGVLEVHLHGSPGIVREVLAVLRRGHDARHHLAADSASPEPRSRTLEQQARQAVPGAASELGARLLLDQAAGALRRDLHAVQDAPAGQRGALLDALARRGDGALRLLRATPVILVGPVNAGKSTLFNTLVGEDASTVTPEPGTTRDTLGARASLGPWPVLLVDTAGERDLHRAVAAADPRALVEAEGQALARAAAQRAELRFELAPAGGPPEPDTPGVIRFATRASEHLGGSPGGWPDATLSAAEHPEHAREVCRRAFERALGLTADAAWTPGAGAPFTLEWTRAIRELAPCADASPEKLDSFLRGL